MKTTKMSISALAPNTGQIPGLPTNPRSWSGAEVKKLAKSLKETPELFEARPIIVFRYGDQHIILGGNMRYEASLHNKAKEVPVYIVPEGASLRKLKEIVIKDNSSFGSWDADALANEWDDEQLASWGVPDWLLGMGEEMDLDDFFRDKEESQAEDAKLPTIVVTLPSEHNDSREAIEEALRLSLADYPGITIA